MAFFQFDNAGFSGGYCFYAVIHTETKKVLNFIKANFFGGNKFK